MESITKEATEDWTHALGDFGVRQSTATPM